MKFGCSQCGAGHERVYPNGLKHNRDGKFARGYRCQHCGHCGFSVHHELGAKEVREKPPKPIQFEALLPVVAYDNERCNADCDGFGCDSEGDALCQYWGDYLDFADLPPGGTIVMYKRCQRCKEAQK